MREWGFGRSLSLALPGDAHACDVAQAVELVRALREQLHAMSHRLAWLEDQEVGTDGRASAIRSEAGALRQDISEAQILIARLQRRYLNGHGNGHRAR
ncbi:hypothetical protein [Mycobacterium sp. E787]|uniref:hypothetical protein n=1 Tax=Mycobacterium sp. E787 TaxID=1834150 RepID=UPI0007FCCD82|nr:hypothetical protein [Mycobacterium sp. E787]OBI55957.1 hypothetical protein A5705_22670 [Mycobacterium sp. E787]